MTTFWREGHFRGDSWIEGHFVTRNTWSKKTNTPIHLRINQRHEKIQNSNFSSLINPNARCPICHQQVYYYQNINGSKVWFDEIGTPWTKHPCLYSDEHIVSKTHDFSSKSESFITVPCLIEECHTVGEKNYFKLSYCYPDGTKKQSYGITSKPFKFDISNVICTITLPKGIAFFSRNVILNIFFLDHLEQSFYDGYLYLFASSWEVLRYLGSYTEHELVQIEISIQKAKKLRKNNRYKLYNWLYQNTAWTHKALSQYCDLNDKEINEISKESNIYFEEFASPVELNIINEKHLTTFINEGERIFWALTDYKKT